MANINLPALTGEKTLIQKTKNISSKTAKILLSGATLAGCGITVVLALPTMPILVPPALIGAVFSGQKFVNNTIAKSYKDLSFITKRKNNNIRITQDPTRFDLTAKMKGMTNAEKAGFMQLQAIIGLSKFKPYNEKGEEKTFETLSHGINQKTFRKLQDLGYIKDYEDKFKKKSRIPLSKLAFGNIKGIMKEEDMYDIKFKLTGKPLDLEDSKLRKCFPMVFGEKNGIIAKRGYNFKREKDGSLTIDYKPKEPYMEKKTFPHRRNKDNNMKKELTKGVQSLEEQREAAIERMERNAHCIENKDDKAINKESEITE